MEMRSNKNIRIGDVLKEFGYVTDDDIGAALEYSKNHEGVRLGGALIALNIITERQMLEALGRRLQYDVVNISELTVDITDEDGIVTVVFTNDGKPPEGEISESGGLKSLRSTVEQFRGEMEIASEPRFMLTIRVSGKE